MKVVVLGKAGRPLVFHVVDKLINSEYELEYVVLQKRLANKGGNNFTYLIDTIRKNGIEYILHKMVEMWLERKKLNTARLCRRNNIKYTTTSSVNGKDIEQILQSIAPDVIVLAGCPVVKERIFSIAKLYSINVHRSILPKYAGIDGIFWALYHGESEIGATVHTVTKAIDAGKIVVQSKKKVNKNDNVYKLTRWYYSEAPNLIMAALKKINNGDNNFIKQNMELRSYNSWPTKKERKELKNRILKNI